MIFVDNIKCGSPTENTWLSWIALLLSVLCFGQQDAQYTQYLYNTASVNPAYTGSRGHLTASGLYRAQWVGIPGAPETQTLNVHGPVGYRGVALGVSAINDEIGPTSETNFDIDFSYTVQTSREAWLSLGLKASGNLLDIDFTKLNQDQNNTDLLLQENIDNQFAPNIGAGAYYATDRFYLGFSIPRFLQTEHFDKSSLSTAKERMNLYLITGHVWDLNPYIKFKPALLGKMVSGSPLQMDLSANVMVNEKFVLGAGYRWGASFSGLLGTQVTEQFFIGLAYDRETSDLGATTFNDGTFEAVLRFEMMERSTRHTGSRRFF